MFIMNKVKNTGPFFRHSFSRECYVITIFSERKRNSQNGIANLSISGQYIPTVKISLLTRS